MKGKIKYEYCTNLAVGRAIAIGDLWSRHLGWCVTLDLHCLGIFRIVNRGSKSIVACSLYNYEVLMNESKLMSDP